MTLECINPDDLPTPATYTQVIVATGSKLVFVSGQEPEDIQGKLVGRGDLAAQARQVFGNLDGSCQLKIILATLHLAHLAAGRPLCKATSSGRP